MKGKLCFNSGSTMVTRNKLFIRIQYYNVVITMYENRLLVTLFPYYL